MYSPFIFAAVIAWLHLLICVIIVVFHLLSKDWPKIFGTLWAGNCIINLVGKFFNIMLIIAGLAGVGNIPIR